MSLWVKLFAEWGTSVRLGHSQCCWLSSLENPAQPVETERKKSSSWLFRKAWPLAFQSFLFIYLLHTCHLLQSYKESEAIQC